MEKTPVCVLSPCQKWTFWSQNGSPWPPCSSGLCLKGIKSGCRLHEKSSDGYGDLTALSFLPSEMSCSGGRGCQVLQKVHRRDAAACAGRPHLPASLAGVCSCRGMDAVQEHHTSFKDFWSPSKPQAVVQLLLESHAVGTHRGPFSSSTAGTLM